VLVDKRDLECDLVMASALRVYWNDHRGKSSL